MSQKSEVSAYVVVDNLISPFLVKFGRVSKQGSPMCWVNKKAAFASIDSEQPLLDSVWLVKMVHYTPTTMFLKLIEEVDPASL